MPADGIEPPPARVRTRGGSNILRAVAHNRKALAGLVLLLSFVVLAVFPGQIAPDDPTAEIYQPGLGASFHHLLGTTAYGQDVFSQLIWGTRQSLLIAFAVGGLATLLAVLVGVTAAYIGGTTDGFLSLVTDVILVIPIFPLVIVIAAYQKNAGFATLVIVLGALGWSYGARQLRSQTLSMRMRDFLEAARVRGERRSYIILFEILPTMTSLIVAAFLGAAVFAVLTAAGLQFVGLGDPSSQSWGTMLYWAENNEALGAGMPLWAIMPGVCVALLGASFALLNYAFDEVSNPALRPVRRLRRATVEPLEPATPAAPDTILEVSDLSVAYASGGDPVVAVDHVDLQLARGEFLAIVGESGCGKSTLLYAIAKLLDPPAEVIGGSVRFQGRDLVALSEGELRNIRWSELSVVMQSAMNALNPVLTVGAQMRDACKAHSEMTSAEITARSKDVLRLVSIDPIHLRSYPHQLSGGMRQRAMIAMALLFSPQLMIMDEPTSALDVVAQRSLMGQIKELQQRLGFAVVFVTHDMSLVSHFSDRLVVMYAGQIVELGTTRQCFESPLHPYTRGLLDAFPSFTGRRSAARHPRRAAGPRPSAGRLPLRAALPGTAQCTTTSPRLVDVESELVRCVLYEREMSRRMDEARGERRCRLGRRGAGMSDRCCAPPV